MIKGLPQFVDEYVASGCRVCYLGIASMPDGYALMLDHDEMYYFWLMHDGNTGPINWNKWAVRRGAIAHRDACDGQNRTA